MPMIMTTPLPDDLPGLVRETKARMRRDIGGVDAVMAEIGDEMARKVAAIVDARQNGEPVFPVVAFDDIAAGTVPEAARAAIRDRGCVVVRQTFERATA